MGRRQSPCGCWACRQGPRALGDVPCAPGGRRGGAWGSSHGTKRVRWQRLTLASGRPQDRAASQARAGPGPGPPRGPHLQGGCGFCRDGGAQVLADLPPRAGFHTSKGRREGRGRHPLHVAQGRQTPVVALGTRTPPPPNADWGPPSSCRQAGQAHVGRLGTYSRWVVPRGHCPAGGTGAQGRRHQPPRGGAQDPAFPGAALSGDLLQAKVRAPPTKPTFHHKP